MRGDARRFRLVASRLLYEPENAHFAPIALRFVRNVCFVEQARGDGENGAERAEVEGPKRSMGAPVRDPGGEKEGAFDGAK